MSCKPQKSNFQLSPASGSDGFLNVAAKWLQPVGSFSFLRDTEPVKQRLVKLATAGATCIAVLASGCTRSVPTYLNDTGELSYYLDQATAVEYPDTETASLDEVTQAHTPMTVIDPDFQSYEEISLEDCVSYTLQNGKVFRGYGTPSLQGTRVSPGQDNLANGPSAAGTIYNVAIRETEPGFIGTPGQISNPGSITTNGGLDGNIGVEAALAEFDAQLTSGLTYGKTDQPRNVLPGGNFLEPTIFQQDQVQWNSEIAKKAANGTQIFFRNINTYTANSNPLVSNVPAGLQVLDSFYQASFEAEVRQPLLRGRGTFINRMPVVISRIGTDQIIANLESQLQNVVTNVEIRYWDLYCAYRNLDAAKTGRDAALQTWRIVKSQFDEGAEVNIQQVAQASEQYHFFDAQVIDAYNSLLNAEGALRFLMGWSSTDGRVLRPSDLPVQAPVEFAWCESLCEALTYRPELRQEKWEIKKKELSLAYSKNGLLPELNATMLYRWLGLGNKFGTSGDSQPYPGFESGALNELYGGDFQELSFGVDFKMPVGFRRELANVRNAQLKLAQEIARLEDMELDVTKELSEAFRALAANQLIMQSSFNRWKDTTIEKDHFDELRDAGVETLDVALDAQRRQSQAEIAFYTAMCEYNKTIALIHRRKGTILPYCGVCFEEGPWSGKAYMDAEENSRRRSASRELNYGWTRPQVISRGGDQPTAYNNGATVSGQQPSEIYYNEGGQIPMDAPMHMNAPMEGDIYNGPYYEHEMFEQPIYDSAPAPNLQMNPTPAKHRKSSRLMRDSQVRQTGYEEASRPDQAGQAASSDRHAGETSSRNRHVPIVSRNELSAPDRDMATRPTKRLRARTGSAPVPTMAIEPNVTPTATPVSASSTTSGAVPTQANLDWKRLGMTQPVSTGQGSVAKIRMK